MKRIGVICAAIVFVFLLSSVASATNWVFVVRDSTENLDIYLDTDSVVKDGDMLSCWTRLVDITPTAAGQTKVLMKLEFKLTHAAQWRYVEWYDYNAAGELTDGERNDNYDNAFAAVERKSRCDTTLAAARKHAKKGTVGKGMGPMPTP